ncbi:hypothetical protein C4D60_Mb11t03350 [Musa balbisiana]|uniref:Ribonuclease P/MRP protein subunit POP5 n=1 Tax=Musa balbisiana TaxID=52838 RepID=A0A4S8J3V9_MUSBA|nr:hypothetical protein C4D60_Mb11t03350 [Musa balbisiana]
MVQFKNRYMVMEIFIDGEKELVGGDPKKILSSNNVSRAIKDSIQLNFGECGLALSLGSFQVKYLNALTKICIIRTSHVDHQKVWSAITMIRSIGNCPAMFNLLDLSGSIRTCKTAALKCEEMKFEQYIVAAGDHCAQDITDIMKESIDKINALES